VKLVEAFLWQPHWPHKEGILINAAILVTAISLLHTATGLTCEFHTFYIVPVLALSWFLGARYGYALSLLASVQWFLADRILAGEQAALLPMVFKPPIRCPGTTPAGAVYCGVH